MTVIHGESRRGCMTPEYRAWVGMKGRCLTPSHHKYPSYGGRGIRVHDVWVRDFAAFLAHVGRRPSGEHSLDRIDVNGHYEPGNVRWADRKVQSTNRRTTRLVEADGAAKSMAEWSRETGLSAATIKYRLDNGKRGAAAVSAAKRACRDRCSDAVANAARRLRAAGMARRDVAATLGLGYWTVRDIDRGKSHG